MTSVDRTSVLFVNHEIEIGGAEMSLLALIEHLDPARFRPLLACSGEGPLAQRGVALGATVHFVPMQFRRGLRKAVGLARAAGPLRRLIDAEGIHVLHANTLAAGYACSLARRRSGTRLIWHVRDLGYPMPARRLLRSADRVLFNSNATCRDVCGDEPWHNTAVVYNGIANAFFDAGSDAQRSSGVSLRRELDIPLDHTVVGICGRLDPQKGHRTFLMAARRVASRCDKVCFVVVGDVALSDGRRRFAGYRTELEQLARDLGIADRVRFAGHRTDMPRVLTALDLLVHPTEQFEAFGRSIAEAHAAGKPVVASRLGGIPEVLIDGVNGLLCAPGDSIELAARILELVSDPHLAQRLGAAGRCQALARFGAARQAQTIMEIYEELSTACW